MENFRATVINQSGLRINEALSTQARFQKHLFSDRWLAEGASSKHQIENE